MTVLFDVANEGTAYPPVISTWAQLIASFDNDASAYSSYDTLDVVTQDSTASNWPDGIGALDLATVTGAPVHDSTPGEVLFDGTNDTFADAQTFSGNWTLIVRFRCDAGADVSPIGLSNHAESTNGRASIFVGSARTSVSAIWNSDAPADNTRSVTMTVGTGYHVAFLRYDGTNLILRVDDETPASLAISGAATLTRLTVGCLQQAASQFYHHDGGISHVAAVNGRCLTDGEEDTALAFLLAL